MRRKLSSLGVGRAALLPPAAYAVHELRYELAYGVHASAELRETGHSYLHSVVPWLVALVGIAAGSFLLRAGTALRTRRAERRFSVSFGAMWALCWLALVLIFSCQETLEGIFATGHPGGFTGVFGDGGWWAVPVALVVGLILAAVFHGARWAIARMAGWRRRPSRPRRAAPSILRPPALCAVRPAPLLAGPSSRGPPA